MQTARASIWRGGRSPSIPALAFARTRSVEIHLSILDQAGVRGALGLIVEAIIRSHEDSLPCLPEAACAAERALNILARRWRVWAFRCSSNRHVSMRALGRV